MGEIRETCRGDWLARRNLNPRAKKAQSVWPNHLSSHIVAWLACAGRYFCAQKPCLGIIVPFIWRDTRFWFPYFFVKHFDLMITHSDPLSTSCILWFVGARMGELRKHTEEVFPDLHIAIQILKQKIQSVRPTHLRSYFVAWWASRVGYFCMQKKLKWFGIMAPFVWRDTSVAASKNISLPSKQENHLLTVWEG